VASGKSAATMITATPGARNATARRVAPTLQRIHLPDRKHPLDFRLANAAERSALTTTSRGRAARAMDEMIAVRHLTKRFGPITAVEDVSFTVARGEVLGFLGPNGAGKSTTIGIALGLLEATSGTVQLFNRSPRDPTALRCVGYMPETPVFAEHHTVRSLLEWHCGLLQIVSNRKRENVQRALALAGMLNAREHRLRALSKAMLQRVALAVALLGPPDLLVLDEPTSNLDPVGRRELCELMRAERARGAALLFASHVLAETESVCDRVVILANGQVALQGSVHDLCENAVPARSLEEVFFAAISERSGISR
jgi:ABC-2 type transport system ATP-binding protein